jgi:hypothetical protein
MIQKTACTTERTVVMFMSAKDKAKGIRQENIYKLYESGIKFDL